MLIKIEDANHINFQTIYFFGQFFKQFIDQLSFLNEYFEIFKSDLYIKGWRGVYFSCIIINFLYLYYILSVTLYRGIWVLPISSIYIWVVIKKVFYIWVKCQKYTCFHQDHLVPYFLS